MKCHNLLEQIDSFNNKQQKGLFTFYLQTTNPQSIIASKNVFCEKEICPKFQSINKKATQIKKINQYRMNNKPERRLKTLGACSESSKQQESGNEHSLKKRLAKNSDQQFDKVKEMFNFKRQKSKKILEQLLTQNQVDNDLIDKLKRQRQQKNPQNLINKKYTLNQYPQHLTPFNSNYSSKIQSKNYRSLEKYDGLNKKLSEQIISLKQKCDFNPIIAYDGLNIPFNLQEQRFRSIIFPFSKKRNSSFLRGNNMQNSQLSSNDDLIQKLKNSNKIIQGNKEYHQNIVFDTKGSQTQQQENQQVQAFQLKRKANKQLLLNRLEKSFENRLQVRNCLENEIDLDCFLRGRINSLQKKKIFDIQQRRNNYSEIKTRNSVPFLQNNSALEKVFRRYKYPNQKEIQKNRIKERINDLSLLKGEISTNLSDMKKKFLIIVTKAKDKYVSI